MGQDIEHRAPTWRGLIFALAATMIASVADAQEAATATNSFHSGIAAYAAGQDDLAVELLGAAIRENPADPRPYYLRCLSLLRLGRPIEGRADLAIGSRLEARQPNAFDVEVLLQSMPIAGRALVDAYRYRARTGESLDPQLVSEQGAPSNVGVLRQKISVPMEQLAASGSLAEWLESARAAQAVSNAQEDLPAPAASATDASHLADPFVDDPLPTAAADQPSTTIAPAAHSDAPSSGTIPSSKLIGILGRAIGSAAPVPPLEGLRDKLPAWAVPQGSPAATDATEDDDLTSPNKDSAAEEEDPFAF